MTVDPIPPEPLRYPPASRSLADAAARLAETLPAVASWLTYEAGRAADDEYRANVAADAVQASIPASYSPSTMHACAVALALLPERTPTA